MNRIILGVYYFFRSVREGLLITLGGTYVGFKGLGRDSDHASQGVRDRIRTILGL